MADITSTAARTEFNDVILAFNTTLGGWMKFTGVNPEYMRDSFDTSGKNRVFVGDNHGYVYRIDRDSTLHEGAQGIESDDLSGTATGGSTTTVTDTGATWATTPGDALKGMLIEIVDATDSSRHLARILTNTATSITFDPAASFTVASGDTYNIALIDAFWVSKWLDFGSSVETKNMDRLEVILSAVSTGSLEIDDVIDWSDSFTSRTQSLTALTRQEIDLNIRRKLKALRIRFRNRTPSEFIEIVRFILSITISEDQAGRQTESFGS